MGGIVGLDIQERVSLTCIVQKIPYCWACVLMQSFSIGCGDIYLIELSQFKFYSHNLLLAIW